MIKNKIGLLATLPLAIASINANAIQLDWSGPGNIAWDNNVSQGTLWRITSQDESNDGINGNDGNRNYDKGIVAQTLKLTTELDWNFDNFGAFVRATAHKDFDMSGETHYGDEAFHDGQPSQVGYRGTEADNQFTDEAKDNVGERAEFLDAYLYGFTDIGDMTLSGKVGRHVIFWGESMFYRNGIGDTLAVDAGTLKLPGVGLKEALLPTNALSLNLSMSENIDMEAFYMLEYRETRLTPVGSFYSTGDLFAPGGNTGYNATAAALTNPILKGVYNGLVTGGVATDLYYEDDYMQVAKITDEQLAKDDGQFGLGFRFRIEELNDTEFGTYFVNYHAKTPTVSARINQEGHNPGAVAAQAQASATAAITQATTAQFPAGTPQATIDAAVQQQLAANLASIVGGTVALETAANIEANRSYQEDLKVMGLSFNTMVGLTAIAGEVAYRPDMPINVSHDDDLVQDVLQQVNEYTGTGDADGNLILSGQEISLAQAYEGFDNITERDVINASVNATHNFGRSPFSDQVIMMAEVAGEQIQGDLTYTAHNGDERELVSRANCSSFSTCVDSGKITKNAWGYSIFVQSTWNNVFTGTQLSSTIRYKNDVEGTSHRTGNFAEGTQALTASIDASVFGDFKTSVSYTDFYGGANNKLRDRDTISLTMNYSF